jgi:dolichyl-phosphate-mannose--protein O-mannosyl transferase
MLLVVGLVTRLWNIADPRTQVFDETHFTKFATWCERPRHHVLRVRDSTAAAHPVKRVFFVVAVGRYVSGHYYVDIHPPLAKLVFALVRVAELPRLWRS